EGAEGRIGQLKVSFKIYPWRVWMYDQRQIKRINDYKNKEAEQWSRAEEQRIVDLKINNNNKNKKKNNKKKKEKKKEKERGNNNNIKKQQQLTIPRPAKDQNDSGSLLLSRKVLAILLRARFKHLALPFCSGVYDVAEEKVYWRAFWDGVRGNCTSLRRDPNICAIEMIWVQLKGLLGVGYGKFVQSSVEKIQELLVKVAYDIRWAK
ncbi:hypothetical protein PPACK8108_LOCUS1588, partial [Phakopsora pachyrhizi]